MRFQGKGIESEDGCVFDRLDFECFDWFSILIFSPVHQQPSLGEGSPSWDVGRDRDVANYPRQRYRVMMGGSLSVSSDHTCFYEDSNSNSDNL